MEVRVKINYFIISSIALIAMALNRYFASHGMIWYKAIKLPFFSPPGWLIGTVWQIIYVLFTAAVMVVWNKFDRNMQFWLIIILFFINIFLNIYWTYFFFYQQRIGAATIDAIVIEFVVLLLIFLLWPQSPMVSCFLVPYAAWLLFAIFLNSIIWYIN
ncbi:MAG: tryptophan-rich sensory protein [Candidatus Babeliales bacterium]